MSLIRLGSITVFVDLFQSQGIKLRYMQVNNIHEYLHSLYKTAVMWLQHQLAPAMHKHQAVNIFPLGSNQGSISSWKDIHAHFLSLFNMSKFIQQSHFWCNYNAFSVCTFPHIQNYKLLSSIHIQKYFKEDQEAKLWYSEFVGQLESV